MSYALVALAVFGLITSTIFTGIVLAAVPGYLREQRAALAHLVQRPGFTPPLTLLKPLHGAEPGLEAHLATFFEQDYPAYEILFCARSASDRRSRRSAPRRHASPAHPCPIPLHRRPARLHQRQSDFDGADGGGRHPRHPRHQRQRCARHVRLSARRRSAFCRPAASAA